MQMSDTPPLRRYLVKILTRKPKQTSSFWLESTMEDGGVDRTVIDCQQNQLGQMADFPPHLTFLIFDLSYIFEIIIIQQQRWGMLKLSGLNFNSISPYRRCGKEISLSQRNPKGTTYVYTVAVWIKKKFIPLLTLTQGSQWCQKMHQDPLNLNLEVWCANIEPKLHNLQKTVKIAKKIINETFFLTVFQRFCNLGSILAHQTSKFEFIGSWCIFWHPGPGTLWCTSIVEIQEF